MVWKNFAIAPQRRVVATALMYGLSLAVRFTSVAGGETEIPAQVVQNTNPMISIMINDSAPILYENWPQRLAQPIVFRRSGPLVSRGCRVECERPMPLPSMLDCPPP